MMGTPFIGNKIMVRPTDADDAGSRTLSPEAARALAEARERRARRDQQEVQREREREIDGRDGPDPVRYGDWEVKGIASDF